MLQDFIESVSFCSTNSLKDQQLTQDGIPVIKLENIFSMSKKINKYFLQVIVDKCICFVYSHGCLTEGTLKQY